MSLFVRGILTAALLGVVACRSSSPSLTGAPELQITSTAGAHFLGCPSADIPDQKVFDIQNVGTGKAKLTVSVTGPNAQDFKPVSETLPSELAPGATGHIHIRFQPTAPGESKAQLLIDDGDDATPELSVALEGKSEDLGEHPTLVVALQSKDDPNLMTDCFAGGTCMPTFADTFFGQSTTLTIALRNEGCPALKITGATLIKDPNYVSQTLAFYLDEPAVPPTPNAPWVLMTAGNNREKTLVVRFSPENDGSEDGQRYGTLQLTTNDPSLPVFNVTLYGFGTKPALSVSPSSCDFSDPSQNCGNAPRIANEARFRVQNEGTGPLTIGSVTLDKGGQGRFAITQNIVGTTLGPGDETILVAKHTEQTLYVSDGILIDAGPAGSVSAWLSGGKPPRLSAEPDIRLDFGSSVEPVAEKTVTVRADATGGALIIHRVWLEVSNSFSLGASVPTDTRIEAGQSTDIRVVYRRPASGGQQVGALHIETNDPRFSAPSHKVITLYSNTPADPPPTSVLTACTPAELTTKPLCRGGTTAALTVSLAQLGTDRQITLSGIDSFDSSGLQEQRPVSEYEFRLARKPSSAGAVAKLENDGTRTTKATALLTLDPTAPGEYRVLLRTFDDQKQASSPWAELRVYAQ